LVDANGYLANCGYSEAEENAGPLDDWPSSFARERDWIGDVGSMIACKVERTLANDFVVFEVGSELRGLI